MTMIGDLERLYERLMQVETFLPAVEAGTRTTDEVLAAWGIDKTSICHGGVDFKQWISADNKFEHAGVAYSIAYARGHAAGIRRAALAASAPEARGREAELFGLLLRGFSIDAALARLAASSHDQHQCALLSGCSGNDCH